MRDRAGIVLYWLGVTSAVLILAFGIFVAIRFVVGIIRGADVPPPYLLSLSMMAAGPTPHIREQFERGRCSKHWPIAGGEQPHQRSDRRNSLQALLTLEAPSPNGLDFFAARRIKSAIASC